MHALSGAHATIEQLRAVPAQHAIDNTQARQGICGVLVGRIKRP